jgi:hypothetical protein
LKTEYEEASRVVTFAHTAEAKAKELILAFRGKIEILAGQVRRGEAFCFGEEDSIFEVSQDVSNLMKEKAAADKEIDGYKTQIAQNNAAMKQLRDNISILSGEADRLGASVDQHMNLLQEVQETNYENHTAVLQLKHEVVQQRADLEAAIRQRNDHQRKREGLRQMQYELMTVLGQLRDESRSCRERLARKQKIQSELRNSATNKDAHCDRIKTQLSQEERGIETCSRYLQDEHRNGDELQALYEEMLEESQKIGVQRLKCRRVVRQLRSDLIDVQFKLAQSDNDIRQKVRGISAHRLTLQFEKKKGAEAVSKTHEVIEQGVTVKGETRSQKVHLQKMKEKILRTMTEIDNLKAECMQVDTKVQMTREADAIIQEQNQKHLLVLDDYKKKNADQTALADHLRVERNNYKRQFETVSVEVEELRTQCNQLDIEIRALQEHFEEIMLMTVDTHANHLVVAQRRKFLLNTTEDQKKGMLETERTISRLQAESQTLTHIWTEAQHDRLQMKKEHQVLENNQKAARDELMKKSKTIEKMRWDIAIEQVFLKKCQSQYIGKVAEVMTHMSELAALKEKTRELEEKRERMLGLDYETHRLAIEAMFERQKCVALIHELSVPRNVHRWDAIAAVDPTFVKHIQYHGQLTGKIDAAHRELIRLHEIRDQLKVEARTVALRGGSGMTRDQAVEYIKKYTEDIAEKDAVIAEMHKLFQRNTPAMHKSIESVQGLRQKVTDRLGTATRLRTRSVAAMRPQAGEGVTWFMTEVPVDTFTGGGFLRPTAVQLAGTRSNNGAVELKMDALSPPNKRAKSSLLNLVSKRVTKPAKTSGSRSPSRRILPPFQRGDL